MRISGWFRLWVVAAVWLTSFRIAQAAPLRPADVPTPLRPWIPWALRGHEVEACPTSGPDGTPACAWAGRLTLLLDGKGGRFGQDWQVLTRTFVPLPGDAEHWPLDVKANGKPVAVVENDGEPSIELPAGRHALTGAFQWTTLPESIPVPTETGIVAVTVNGRRIAFPGRTDDGELFLQKAAAPAETDSLQITVHRKLTDAVPVLLTTRISLEVAGKAREVTLGKSLPAGFVPHALESPLPARIEADGRLRVQVRPGSWVLTLTARGATDGPAPPAKVVRPAPDGPWKAGEEVWVFEAAPDLRVVTVEGVPSIDPQQTTLPDAWKRLPGYVMAPGATLTLVERRRGDADPAPDQLTLARKLWLDFDGGGYTAEDRINGSFRRSWRLGMGPSEKLGRVTIGGVDQFITRLPGGAGGDGVEIRQGSANVVAASRIQGPARDFPIAGWNHDFQSVNASLALPPGWQLLHATGVDGVSQTWLRGWTLLELFLVLVCALAAAKLFGPRAGVLTLLALGLTVTQPDAPQWLWLAVLIGEALVRALGRGKLGKLVELAQLGAWLALVLLAVPYAVQELRVGLFPAQADPNNERDRYVEEIPEAPPPRSPARARQHYSEGAEGRDSALGPDAERRAKLAETVKASGMLNLLGAKGDEGGNIADAFQGVGGIGIASGSGSELRGIAGGGSSSGALRGGAGIGGAKYKDTQAKTRSVSAPPPAKSAQNLESYDPSVIVQTGPGVPRWSWRMISLTWNGPVERTQRLSLWLISPAMGAVLAILRVGLLAALALLLLRHTRGIFRSFFNARTTTAMVLLLLSMLTVSPARAQGFPSDELIEQLREGLLEKPACGGNCATVGRLSLEAAPDRLRIRLEVSAAAAASVALPGHREHWVPTDVLVDGKTAPQLLGSNNGTLWLSVTAGSHQVVLEGPLPPREVVQLPLPQKPHVVASTLHGWKLAGVGDDGAIADTLQLSREAQRSAGGEEKHDGTAALAAKSLPPFVTVERTLHLGLKWQAHTRVVRATPTGAAALLNVPLLPGESPLGEGLRIAQGNVQVAMEPDATEVEWTSTLEQRETLALRAARSPSFSEVWRLDLGPLWHAEVTGIPPVHRDDGADRTPEWRPWPGETVTLAITRPGGTEGQSLTIENAGIAMEPGARSTKTVATLELRSSRGGQHVITLPPGATLEALSVAGSQQPLRQDGARVTIPLKPGHQGATLTYRDPVGLGVLYTTRAPNFAAPAANVDTEVRLPNDRWILLVGGPRLGPSVLFWSQLIVLLLVAVVLGRSPHLPLRTHHWVLLGLGLSQTPVAAAAIVAGYFVVMDLRRRRADLNSKWLFDARQIGLVIWTVVAAAILFIAVREGLLATPDMHIAGNGSGRTLLRWYSDRTGPTPPTAWVLSVPLLVYRLAMLAWALWLAVALIRWSRWAWSSFSTDGLWRRLRRPKAPI